MLLRVGLLPIENLTNLHLSSTFPCYVPLLRMVLLSRREGLAIAHHAWRGAAWQALCFNKMKEKSIVNCSTDG